MPSTIPTIHEELGRLRQADLLRGIHFQSAREASEAGSHRPTHARRVTAMIVAVVAALLSVHAGRRDPMGEWQR